jgi:hypothetical protein
VLPKFTPQLSLDFLEVEGLHCRARTAIYPWFIPNDLGAKWLWESADRLAQVSLEELDYGGREVKLIGACKDISL